MRNGSAQQRPFFKVLVANRGEIALRVMRSARRLGLGVVAVYSDADRDALHVRQADQAVRIGEALPAQSYLNISAIIAAANASGADAVHPGYGFLAENEEFAQACKEAGLVFIGPSSQAIEAMGNKAGAKELMKRAGVPIVPGYQGAEQDDEVMLGEAGRIGFPVMIKAVAGGGGRGMRLVADAASFPGALRSARSEAKAAFGDPTVILERAIQNPRHIEIQVLGDAHGNAIHLGERDCSVQRRHQKLIEEAPSPAVTPELRAKMGEVAVAAVKALRYEGAGTLEFLLDENGEFYFMEMNTRLQVEHPVTEAITGLDLVELQLRIARGEPLPVKQQDVRFSGHAIEVRLCSEDAAHDFMPQSGRMARWQVPEGIRVEHALQSGSEIPPFYDSMIAKVIAHGATREEARSRLICGLEQLTAFGVTTNQAFLMSCLRHPGFARGEATTAFIGAHRDELLAPGKASAFEAALAGLLLYVTDPHAPSWRGGRSLAATFPLPVRIEIAGRVHELEVTRERDGSYTVAGDGRQDRFEIDQLESDAVRFRHDGVMDNAKFLRDGDRLYLGHRGIPLAVTDLTLAAPKAAAANGGDGKVRAAMNGRVVAVLVKPGDRVTAGQPVMTLEAMKMEHVHKAGIDGVVSAIDVTEGEQVTTGKIVVEIEAG
ncbi:MULTISPECIES: acetyl-CoA carboxylase biotin carboxylase subunit [unclassified Bradyrhizobium]|uniref:acetyl/propionyl/methylcrotonyl-CoA carboxylase subunit alpha n=1 Tax=unclassified Bradyrhizobium TaxID=2631580 RepID=UPI0024785301|nr:MULTISPECIES: acetyl-CoA carboxylase biotin carboxylase subunit [unclassified Bradyrhizobium]WGR71234.1 acetyl-CoA carboxylase biotin carboxylase subunit [Bradyrhizobium sp. ISRA426]WGR76070.1 acetyl-CoA carboxylase biotin carboxylase subunit [Bradyrhizobium sp. ISRA430]WGR86475.1 acetyl-CoA carboxylase biotin carboxylase subunit [Bradyrhizobium sp. ISRA432]